MYILRKDIGMGDGSENSNYPLGGIQVLRHQRGGWVAGLAK